MYLQVDHTFIVDMFIDTTFTKKVHSSHVQSTVVDPSTSQHPFMVIYNAFF